MTTRIHLSIMQPAGYIHSQGFLDQARYARYQFRRLGADVTIGKNRLREDSINIIFGAHLGFDANLKQRYTCVFFNLEQLGEGGARVSQDYMNLLRSSAVIDYDERNLAAYGCQPGDVPVVSFQYAPYLATAPNLPLQDRPIDLLFFGSINERRKAIFSRIEACGWSVSMFDHPLYGEERDQFIRQAKAVFNCHFYESSRFEQARAFHTLSLGTPVISERTERTTPPPAFEDAVSWVSDDQLEDFFQHEFMRPAWLERAQGQLQHFSNTDPQEQWQVVQQYCQALHGMEDKASKIWRPTVMNLGSGKDYKLGWLNVDILERAQPDLVVDLGQAVTLPMRAKTLGGGHVLIEAGSLDGIYANNVLEHVPDLPCLMTNLLSLLKEDGEVELEVPYEQAMTAWQDPTHLRAMNMNSWLCYTSWFWYIGWFEHRFEISNIQWINKQQMPCPESEAVLVKISLKKKSTTPHERSIARSMQANFGHIPDDTHTDNHAVIQKYNKTPGTKFAGSTRETVKGNASSASGVPNGEIFRDKEYTEIDKNVYRKNISDSSEKRTKQNKIIPNDNKNQKLNAALHSPLCSIIIPVFNKVEFTQQCLDKLAESAPLDLYELIIVDNASTDGTCEYLKSLDSKAKVFYNSENIGFVGACNQGAAAASGRYLVFLNNDTVPIFGWLEALVSMMEKDQRIGAAGARLIYPDGRLQEAGGLIFNDGSGWNFGRFDNPEANQYTRACEVDYCSGAALMVRREIFEQLGGFDTRYAPAYYEDTDLCFGVRNLGYKVMYCPESTVIHFEGVTAGTDLSSGYKRYQEINKPKFKEKWQVALKQQDPPPRISGQRPITADRSRLVRMATTPQVSEIVSGAPHVLIIDPFLPMHDRASGSLRLFRIVQILRALNCQVTFIARDGTGQERYQHELAAMGVKVYATDPEKLAQLGRSSLAPRVDLAKILREHPCQLAWLSFYGIAEQYLPEIRKYSPNTKILVDTVDVHFLREKRQAELSQDVIGLAKADATRLRELRIYGLSDVVCTVTDSDADTLHDAGLIVPTLTVPNIHMVENSTFTRQERRGLVFVGNFNHTPNIDAILWFVKHVLPIIRDKLPDISLDIVGNNPTAAVQSLAGPGVTVHGWVPDTAPYLDRALISVAPIRVGAGMKGKVGEALSRGLPVVTTSIGAEGMGLTNGKDVCISDSAETFAEAVVNLHNNGVLWDQMAQNGRKLINQRYSADSVAIAIQCLLETITLNNSPVRNSVNAVRTQEQSPPIYT